MSFSNLPSLVFICTHKTNLMHHVHWAQTCGVLARHWAGLQPADGKKYGQRAMNNSRVFSVSGMFNKCLDTDGSYPRVKPTWAIGALLASVCDAGPTLPRRQPVISCVRGICPQWGELQGIKSPFVPTSYINKRNPLRAIILFFFISYTQLHNSHIGSKLFSFRENWGQTWLYFNSRKKLL